MLSLVIIIITIVIVIAIRKRKSGWYKTIQIIYMCLIAMEIIMAMTVERNDNGYVQQQINLVIERNYEIERLIQMTQDTSIQAYLQEMIDYNNSELKKCYKSQKRVPLYKWLLYFEN